MSELDDPARPIPQVFGRARFDRAARELRIDDRRAPLGPRAFDLLAMLVENRDRAVSKHELLDTVWRGVVVEENNIEVQISTLRRLLGPHAISTIPGRGYRFMLHCDGEVLPDAATAQPLRQALPTLRTDGNLPAQLPEIYGREADCEAVRSMSERHGLLTIVGAAGIGKTRLALAVAQSVRERFSEGVWIVDLAALNDPRLLVQTVAQALRLTLPGLRDASAELAAALRGQHALLVFDNCEHLVDGVGDLVATLLRETGSLHVLATSQEPLKLAVEQLHRLAPLSVPLEATVVDATSYGAVRLFVERVRALLPRFAATEANVSGIVEICRRLDGLPLAIEMAAARVPVLGVAGVRDRLGERFRVLTGGSRIAPRRHQTMRAALDWSHDMLDERERCMYRRLGAFVGTFSLESAQELTIDTDIDEWQALDLLSGLVDKSLLIAEGDPKPRYRLLETTREHALEKLAAAGETDEWIARHARATWNSLDRAIKSRRTDLVLAEMGNVRSAYEWARCERGDAATAVALATLPSMVIAVEGAVQEARQRLLEVEPLIGDGVPADLVAQYWQWYGRIGLDGRLPASRCVEAFRRAEMLFVQQKNLRHVHACRRHLAEALLDAGELDQAIAALERARAMEDSEWPVADRMRRLRVEGLCMAKQGHTEEALRAATAALAMAQHAGIDRYELVLLDDIARTYLEAGNAAEAAARYRTLAERARASLNSGLTLSNALAGLVAALTAENELDAANRVAREALHALGRSAILVARADILACLMARRQRFELAGRLLGASERFRSLCETPRDVIEARCRDEAIALLSAAVEESVVARWIAAGESNTEEELAAAVGAA